MYMGPISIMYRGKRFLIQPEVQTPMFNYGSFASGCLFPVFRDWALDNIPCGMNVCGSCNW